MGEGCGQGRLIEQENRGSAARLLTQYRAKRFVSAGEPARTDNDQVNLLAEQVRQVAREDKASLVESTMAFNIHALVGGQMEKDTEAKLYLLYPEDNWVDTGKAHAVPRNCTC